MRTIWKYKIDLHGPNRRNVQHTPVYAFDIPAANPRFLTLQVQDGTPTFWMEVHAEAAETTRYFAVIGTGCVIPMFAREHLATWQAGTMVWHLYSVDADHMEAVAS